MGGRTTKRDGINHWSKRVKRELSGCLSEIYADIGRQAAAQDAQVRASFISSQEALRISGIAGEQLGRMREIFLEEMQKAADQEDAPPYSESQLVLMWSAAAVRMKTPMATASLEAFPEPCPEAAANSRVRPRDLFKAGGSYGRQAYIEDKLKKAAEELKQLPNPPAAVREYLLAAQRLQSYLKEGGTLDAPADSLSETLEARQDIVRGKLEKWVDAVGETLLETQPPL